MTSQRILWDIDLTTILKIVLVLAGVFFVVILREVILVLFVAIIIASAIGPIASRFQAQRIPRIVAVVVIYLFFVSLLIIFLSLIIPALSVQLNQLLRNLPALFAGASDTLHGASAPLVNQIQKIVDSLGKLTELSANSYLNLLFDVFGGAVSFVSIIVISFYLSIMPEGVTSFFRSLLPGRYEEYVISLWKRAEKRVGRWVQGQLVLAFSMGLIVYIGLSIMGVKYALLLGLTALIFEVVPFAGPVIAGALAILFAFSQSTSLGIWVAIFYMIVQQLEGHILVPLIIGKSLGLNPVTVVIALLVGAKIAGILGVLLAVPVAVVIVEIIEDLAKQRAAPDTVQ